MCKTCVGQEGEPHRGGHRGVDGASPTDMPHSSLQTPGMHAVLCVCLFDHIEHMSHIVSQRGH
jgi:hypothetical protein